MRDIPLYWDADDDMEDVRRYTAGGYHPIRLGDVLSPPSQILGAPSRQYRILHKLGRGAFATAWLAEALQSPSHRFVALKICVADAPPKHELDIFNKLSRVQVPNVIQLLDSFSMQGPNGLHTVLVHDVVGSLTSVIGSPRGRQHARDMCRQIANGLAALHRHGIVHGDLHVGNVGVALPTLNDHSPQDILDHFGNPECTIVLPTGQPSHPDALPPYLVPAISIIDYLYENDTSFPESPMQVEIMDLGSGLIVGGESRPFCTPAAVCASELMFEKVAHSVDPPPTRPSDIWSFACAIYEIVFGSRLFHFAAPNDALLGAMATLSGEVPDSWRSYWHSRERLRDMSISYETADAEWQRRLEHHSKRVPGAEVETAQIIGLLRCMLKLDPKQRLDAEEVLRHPWFSRGSEASD
ncbi:hypothetical protein DXG01_004904 [Tephrocybe rancida]|nr:hypothetical protein DXG01_004904 [Tephrocybe rancida]